MTIATDIDENITDVRAWLHSYAPEPLKTKMEAVLRNRDQLVEILWTYREVFGHAFKDDNADKGCVTGCPGCAMERMLT